jgi:hypothetical protein
MKLSLLFRPRCDREFRLVQRRGRTCALLLAMIASTAAVFVGLFSCWQNSAEQAANADVKPAELVERSAMVRPIANDEAIRAGDLVAIRPNAFTSPTIQMVAAKPNESVIIKRDGAIDSLYMLGESSGIVVVSDQQPSRIVTSDQITGTFVTSSTNR